ncbi:acyl-CoA dehydrogenase family protein [Sphingomonas sp.]|uniref:acyl-CoA dehydrogenase family protein n=1 Tax=Sphingomonas sp. TaxID=28214 RepID=UPI002DEF60F0|nr:acyl-CoA dehydrogenase family protein [Sphingomonas sp.]HEV2569353.1 acyl-CoA dehydrogenase family protein [Sphingomonas sp.]
MLALDEAGFLDALTELSLSEVEPLLRAAGRHGIAGIGEAMAARLTNAPGRPLLAVLAAIEMAGIGERLLEMSVEHANQRSQFGKPIGRFQAVQQQLALMAEQVVLVRIAAQGACRYGVAPPVSAAAIAKSVASTAAPTIAGIAHAVHGAIGITAEFPLHRLTARLHALRMAHGSEGYWNAKLGAERVAFGSDTLSFLRSL